MRIVAWNLKNIGQSKLRKKFFPLITAAGLGNCVLDYIVNVVMGEAAWSAYLGNVPADVFLIIELKSGGTNKGAAATGTAIPALQAVVGAMNTAAAARNLAATYHYSSVPALVIGYHECVGIVYNDRRLTYVANSAAVLRDAVGYLAPRTAFYAAFTDAANNNQRTAMIGIHAPPPSGQQMFRLPVQYTQRLAGVPEVNQAAMNPPKEPLCVAGDFNCDRAASYTLFVQKQATQVNAFALLVNNGYTTQLANGSLSSMRRTLGTVQPATPTNYLSGAYDNVFYKLPGVQNVPVQRVLDLVGNAFDTTQQPAAALYPQRVRALFNAYWTVSDHMPVDIAY